MEPCDALAEIKRTISENEADGYGPEATLRDIIWIVFDYIKSRLG